MISRVLLLLLLLVAAVACAMVGAKDSKSGPAEARSGRGAPSPSARAAGGNRSAVTGRNVGRPSACSSRPTPYWRAHCRLSDALKREGRLGAEVRRLRHAARVARRARTLQARSEGGLPETFRWLGWAFGVCIHGGEGSWSDPDAPYWGGVQADDDFMRTWAPELLRRYGTADHWTPVQQVAMAILAWTERGFAPWPNTSRACGLR